MTRISINIISLLFLSSCTALKFVPEDQKLYTGASVEIKPLEKIGAKLKIKQLVNSNVNPQPNTSILGMRPGLWIYYKMGNVTKKKGLKYFLKNKIGQAPVYISDVDPEKTSNLIRGELINNGYFQAQTSHQVNIEGKKAEVIYTASVRRPYRLRNIDTPTIDTLFANIDSLKRDSYLRKGQRYHLERMEAELERIEEAMENLGYYFFDDRHLIFEADSTVGNRQVDLTLMLEPGVPEKAKRRYTIKQVNVYPDYTFLSDTITAKSDTLTVDNIRIIDRLQNFRPRVIARVINLRPGFFYRKIDETYTLEHIMSLGSFKFANIKFTELASDSSGLNASIYLTPHLRKSLRLEFQTVSKSNNFVGPGANIRFTNRNFLGGSERFELVLSGSYEVQVGRKIPNPLNALELGIESRLTVPRFIAPFRINYSSRRYLPTTDARLGYRVQNRVGFFKLNSFNASFGYTWRENTLKTHEIFPIDINYVRLGAISPEFETLLARNPFLARSFENQFIPGIRYSYTLNTQVNQERQQSFNVQKIQRHNFFLQVNADASGNLMRLLTGESFSRDETDQGKKIFNQAYAQFVRGEIDFRYYLNFSKTNILATRLITALGYAYGNSITMPYIKQFSIGGSNSLRAFPARSIGPGSYYYALDSASENRTFFIDQRGDIRLEANAEFRHDFSNTIKGAIFIDAGNIWLVRDDPNRPGGKFRSGSFTNELAVGTGLGVRFDFSFFVLRFDLAFPLRKPWLESDSRWVLSDINPLDSRWRRDNLILNIAIGYPF